MSRETVPYMKAKVIYECDPRPALYGLGFSYQITSRLDYEDFIANEELVKKLFGIADKLHEKDYGENKFLESIDVKIVIDAPRYWWQEFDTYRVGMTKQSESTMHTLMRGVEDGMFETADDPCIPHVVAVIKNGEPVWRVKSILSEGFIQRRQCSTNYKALRGIYRQRINHKLPHWRMFLQQVTEAVAFPDFIG